MGPDQPTDTLNSPSSPFISILVPASPKATSATVTMPTTMFNTPTSIENLLANIPQLKLNGSNWVIFMMQFLNAMKVTCQWSYFVGSNPKPKVKNPKSQQMQRLRQPQNEFFSHCLCILPFFHIDVLYTHTFHNHFARCLHMQRLLSDSLILS